MKVHGFKILTLLSLMLVLTAGTVCAQSTRHSVDIPFDFMVGQRTLPAGAYTVEPIRRDSRNVWLLQSKTAGVSVLFTTISVWDTKTQEETRLVFNQYEGQNFLAQIWSAGENSGRELAKTKHERQLAKNGSPRDQIVVISQNRMKG